MQQPDINRMMREMQKAQEALVKVQDELAKTPVTGSAGGGAVEVTCMGTLEFTKVKIKADAVDKEDVGTLEDLVLLAIKDACDKAKLLGEQTARQKGLALPPGMGV